MNAKLSTNNAVMRPREKILQVALDLFIKSGYDATSIDDIRRAADFKSKSGIYSHFRSKEEIAENLKTRILNDIEQQVFAAYKEGLNNPKLQIIGLMRAYIHWGLNHRSEFAFRIIRAQEERMDKGQYDWQKDLEEDKDLSLQTKNIYTLIVGVIQELKKQNYPVRQIPEAALFHMMIGAVSRAVIDRDSFGKCEQTEERTDWTAQTDQVLEACMGILFSEPINY
jgi:AcrR family transcriptional regulator